MLIFTDAQPRGLGYLEIDQRHVGGMPVGRPFFEADTYTCSHCNTVVILNPERKRERYKCKSCSHHICDPCAAKAVTGEVCKPYAVMAQEAIDAATQVTRQPDSSTIFLP